MNERFVCVKVDREERPDIDAIYMEAVQTMTGQGGWPLNAFLTPEQIPFYGGTYFPPEPRHGMPSWRQVLAAVADAWDERRDEIRERGARDGASGSRGGALLAPSDEPMQRGRAGRARSRTSKRPSTRTTAAGARRRSSRRRRRSSSCSRAARSG